jgi:hypothetical protein
MYATMPPDVPAVASYMTGDYTPRIVDPKPNSDEVWTLSPRSDAKIGIKVETTVRHSARYHRWHSDGLLSDLSNVLSDTL